MCQNNESKEIANIVMKSNKTSRNGDIEEILARNWQQFKCCLSLDITMQRPTEPDVPHLTTMQFEATLDFLHFLILTRKYRFLLQFLSKFKGSIDISKVTLAPATGKQNPSRGDSWIFGANYLHLAVKYCPEALEILLQDPRFAQLIRQKSNQRGVYPIHLAVMNETNLSAKLLLDKNEDQLSLEDDRKYTPLFYAAAEGSIANLSLMLELDGSDCKLIERTEAKGKNVLFKARTYETVMLLSKYGADKMHKKDHTNETPLKYLTRKGNQEAPLALLDQQIDDEGEEMYTVNFDIMDEKDEPFDLHNCVIENERDDLVLHPLMETYLQVKWRQVRKLLILEFLLRLLFVLSLTYMTKRYTALTSCEYLDDHGNFILGFQPDETSIFRPKDNNYLYANHDNVEGLFINQTHSHFTFTQDGLNVTEILPITCSNDYLKHFDKDANEDKTLEPLCQLLRQDDLSKCWNYHWGTIFVGILVGLGFLKELLELYAIGWNWKNYLSSKENLLQWIIGILSLGFLIFTPHNVDAGSHLAAWSVFLAWMDLTLLLGRFDYFGEYIFMATSIARRMLKFFIVYFPSFAAFAVAFNILLHSTRLFRGPGSAILKTFAMMLGELEFGSYFAYYKVESSGGSNVSTQLLFILFCFSFAIIVANLLVALTINATDELFKEGGAKQSKKKVNDIRALLTFKEHFKAKRWCIILCYPMNFCLSWFQREKFEDDSVSYHKITTQHQ